MSDVNLLKALVTSLRTESDLVALVGGENTNITRVPKPDKISVPLVGVRIASSTALSKDVTSWKRYLVGIGGYAAVERDAMDIGDEIVSIFDDLSGTNRSFYDFTDSDIKVRSSRWIRRLPRRKDENETISYWVDENVIEIVAYPYSGC